MRKTIILGGVLVGLAQGAQAADLDRDYLRGPIGHEEAPVPYVWDGVYAGAQVGYANAEVDFGNATRGLVAYILRDTVLENEAQVSQWTALPKRDGRDASFGGFIGYNSQWEDAVIGVELNYNRTDLGANAADSISRRFETSTGYLYDTTVTANASARITDYGTLRARAGWAVGNFLPYAMVGLALGRADITRSATVDSFGTDTTGAGRTPVGGFETRNDDKKDAFAYGLAAGLGVDIMLLPNVFLRGEYEYVRFERFADTDVNIHTVRGALGVKFW